MYTTKNGTKLEKFRSQFSSKGYVWGIPCQRVGTGTEPGYHLHRSSPHDRRARQYWSTLAEAKKELGPLSRA